MAWVGSAAFGQVPLPVVPAGTSPLPAQAAPKPPPTAATAASAAAQAAPEPILPPLTASLTDFTGLNVADIRYEGVDFDKSDKLLSELAQKEGDPFDPEKVRQMTRRLFATGRYRNIAVRVERSGQNLTVRFLGIAQYYVGRVLIVGVKQDRLASLLEYGTKLNPGTPYKQTDAASGLDAIKVVLAQNGYFEPNVTVDLRRDDAGQQVNLTYTVAIGAQARVGNVTVNGTNPGITVAEFRKKSKLKTRAKVARETVSTALDNMRTYFQKKDHLEATVALRKSVYDPATRTVNYDFVVEQGPIVKVEVAGAHFSKGRLHLLVPIFEEGTVDNDLVNEATYNIKDYLQQQGYSDVVVKNAIEQPAADQQIVRFSIDKGEHHKVLSVDIQGNRYFTSDLLKENLKVQRADAYNRSGHYSQELVEEDQKTLQAIYRANGFNSAKVTGSVQESDLGANGKPTRVAGVKIVFNVVEGAQQKFGDVKLQGIGGLREADIKPLLQASTGQPFSLIALSGDRDAILGYYLSNGFDQARIEVTQTPNPGNPDITDVGYVVTEGKQVFIGRILESGIHYTRNKTVDRELRVHPGDPLDQSALLQTQRNLYNLALFNEVNAAVQNPDGDAELKNVLIQIAEARRWDVTYGVGFEAQTGLPACNYCTQQGTTAAQQGKAGVSERVSLDVTRINLRGTDDSITLHGSYGLLERVGSVTFQNPHLFSNPRFGAQVSASYSNVQDITTFASSKIQFDARVTQKATRKDTFIYDFEYRRVAVDPNSLAISASLIPQLSQPVRVGGPGITWFHDTRSPSPLDAQKGSYTSVQDFFASSKFGSETDFNRTDISNSTYYVFGRKKYVFARDTRLGFIASFGTNTNSALTACAQLPGQDLLNTNASCNPVPLPERLYAGGATSHRGFGINQAGPRDLQTGYPVGGSAVFVNSFELRLPPPVLPYVADNVSFVLFHDMGNVFQHLDDVFPSFARFHQPDETTCENSSPAPNANNIVIGTCNFNYFSHAIGAGARYKTPVGPIRVDFSYNLNPPSYPQISDQTQPGHFVNNAMPGTGHSGHFNYFFSIGQSF
jgi:outer membrane protein insertion porin family